MKFFGKVAAGIGNTVGKAVPWKCSKCGHVGPVSDFHGNVVEGAKCNKCHKATNVAKDAVHIAGEVVKAPAKLVASACGWDSNSI